MSHARRMSELALRKRMLRQRSAVLRHTLAVQVNTQVAPALGLADRAVSSARWLGRHPQWLVAAGVALAVWRPAGLLRVATRGVWLWKTWLRWQPMLQPLWLRIKASGDGADTRTE
jgi:hypothetical protein